MRLKDRLHLIGRALTFDRLLAFANFMLLVAVGIGTFVEWRNFTSKYDEYTLRSLRVSTNAAEQLPFDYKAVLDVTEVAKFSDGTRLYDVTYDVTNTNLSKAQITVSYSIAELYLGTPNGADLMPGTAAAVNGIPDPWHPAESGRIAWQRVSYETNVADGMSNPKVLNWLAKQYSVIGRGNGLTGQFPTGISSEYEPEFLLRAYPSQYVGVVIAFGINDSIDVTGPDVGMTDEEWPLADADSATSATKLNRRPEKNAAARSSTPQKRRQQPTN